MVPKSDDKKIKQVFFYTYVPKIHSLYQELLRYPPKGYSYIYKEKITAPLYKINENPSISKIYTTLLRKHVNTFQIKERLYKWLPLPRETTLIHSGGFLVRKQFPWVVDMEHVTSLVGYNLDLLEKRKSYIEQMLATPYCKHIIAWTEACKRTIIENLDSSSFQDKISIVRLATHPKKFKKKYSDEKITLLFVGSANLPQHYYSKGAHNVFEAFKIIRKMHDHVKLIARTYVPENTKKELEKIDNVKIIDSVISWKELEKVFKTSDIFLFPGHQTPGMVILDAMSYELPVIATDVWATSEMIQNGKNGLLIPKSNHVPYYVKGFIPNSESKEFKHSVQKVDMLIVSELVKKIELLINNPLLRKKLGKRARFDIETGFLSIKMRNEQLKKIYDKAITEKM